MGILSSLNREQKEAVGLLQIGTFLEYFDLMLYIHMAVLLNELFFPKTDPQTAALLSAFTFCSAYVLRPLGAFIFGYIGDNIGRKATVIITTIMMSISCVIMANLPTYAQIGISATWIVTICRIIQGLSSMGEAIGAEIYVTEITKPPAQYPAVAFIDVAAVVGGMAALGVCSLVTSAGFNWRIAFWIGAGIAVVGSIARTRLRETPEFIDVIKQKKREIEEKKINYDLKTKKVFCLEDFIKGQKINKKSLLAYFGVQCGWPICFYLTFIYMNPILKDVCGYSVEDIIFHNFIISIIVMTTSFLWAVLSFRIYPLKILKFKAIIFVIISVSLPFVLLSTSSPYCLFIIQAFLLIFSLEDMPAQAIFIKSFPIAKRFTSVTFVFASARAVICIITSFGFVYLTKMFGHYGLWIVMFPATIFFLWGVNYFDNRKKHIDQEKEDRQLLKTLDAMIK